MNRSAALALSIGLLAAGCGASSASPSGPTSAPGSAAPGGVSSAPAPSPASPGPVAVSPAAPSPAPTATSEAPTTPGPTPVPPAAPFGLASSAFAAGGSIPAAYTCDGVDVSPGLSWTGIPAGTRALVLLVTDPDASGFAHWIVTDIPPASTGVARGVGTAGASLHQGTNDFGHVGWGGPCPPSGTHRYRFTLYAAARPLGLAGHPRLGAVQAALTGATVLRSVTLQATYRRP